MTKNYNFFKKTVLTLTIAFLTTAGVFAQLNWTGTQTLSNGAVISQNINLTGNVTVNVASGSATISGVISSGSGYTLTKTGSGELFFTGENTYTGTTTISAGTLSIGYNSTTGRVMGNIVNNAKLVFHRSNQYIYDGIISGSGQVIKNLSSKIILTGNNTYTGKTTVLLGILQVGDGVVSTANIGSTSGVVLENSSSVLRFETNGPRTFSKVIS
ncbi:MAG: autotransporter-associated beta strand repeat-containing protein, partial [Lentimicrobiaceae bacterium]|nr:autotransporter-associated beta strand repeat-containing protein [Lentimicrobiaceae bacterium]